MSIEFPCEQCGQALRVPDEAAGRRARCPKCGQISQAPGMVAPRPNPAADSSVVYPPPKDPYAPARGDGGFAATTNPFADAADPFHSPPRTAPSGGTNPYEAPSAMTAYLPGSREDVRRRVAVPAIGLMVVGSVNLLVFAFFVLSFVMEVAQGRASHADLIFFVAVGLLLALKSIPVLYGGIQMSRLKNHTAATVGAILSTLPCCSCWVLGLPMGIWALAVLSDFQVRTVFRQNAVPPV